MIKVHSFICVFALFFLPQTASNEIAKYYGNALPGKYQVSYISHLSTDEQLKQEGYVNCTCKEQPKLIEIPKDKLEDVFFDLINHRTCGGHFTPRICDLLRRCSRCNVQILVCKTHPENKDIQDCVKKWYMIPDQRRNSNGTYNQLVTDSKRRTLSRLLTRNKRQTLGKCIFPNDMKTSDVICFKYEDPHFIKCKQKCLFGHTLEEGISRIMTCNSLEGEWKPRGFEECKPFVDCNLSLKSPGTLSCDTGTSVTPPSCNVTCDRYEDHQQVQRKVQCRVYGGWSRRLPFCVNRYKSMELVPAPRIKLHPLSYDPYFRTSENTQKTQHSDKA